MGTGSHRPIEVLDAYLSAAQKAGRIPTAGADTFARRAGDGSPDAPGAAGHPRAATGPYGVSRFRRPRDLANPA